MTLEEMTALFERQFNVVENGTPDASHEGQPYLIVTVHDIVRAGERREGDAARVRQNWLTQAMQHKGSNRHLLWRVRPVEMFDREALRIYGRFLTLHPSGAWDQ